MDYTSPKIEVIKLKETDVIRTSGGLNVKNEFDADNGSIFDIFG